MSPYVQLATLKAGGGKRRNGADARICRCRPPAAVLAGTAAVCAPGTHDKLRQVDAKRQQKIPGACRQLHSPGQRTGIYGVPDDRISNTAPRTNRHNGRQLIVVHIDSRFERELLTHTFTLAPAESIALKGPGDNTALKGCALPGKVLERSGVHVKIHLDIDENQDKATAIWFPYSADADSFMYCMPHEGESVNLYFRNEWEAEALAVSGARKNGQGCAKTGDYNHRYFTNHERKEMYLSPDTLSFTADESAALKIAIVMTDANGIDIVSARDIVFAAENDIKITGKTITLEVGAAASGAASGATTPGLYLNTGLASIVMKDDVNNFYGKPVKMEGTNKAPCPQPEEVPVEEAEADEENKMTGEDWAELGLAVAGFIPGLGTAAAIGEAGLAAAKGDYLGAGISLLGAIPVFGGLMKVGRSFKAVSKLGSKLSKVLNAGKKVIGKAKKAVKAASAALGRMLTRAVKSIGDQMKMIKDAAERVARKRPGNARYGDGERKISDELYKKLRRNSPNDEIRNKVNEGVEFPIPDPALPGKTITSKMEADHIVTMDKITRMDGFDKLTYEQQLKVLNNPENFAGLSKTANTSKGSKSYEEWTTYKKEDIEVNPEFRQKMMEKSSELEGKIQKQIDDLLKNK